MKRYSLNIDDLIERYVAGESEKALADDLGVSRGVVRRRLKERGVHIRGRSEAETVKWRRMTSTQRRHQVTAAHEASRGRQRRPEEQVRVATTVEANWRKHATPNELQLGAWLRGRDMDIIHQQAIGPYNCDIGMRPIAVEIYGGNWHWTGRHAARMEERFRYLFDAGWHIAVVHVTSWAPLDVGCADELVAWYEEASRNPSAAREYRVIRSGPKVVTVATSDDDEIPTVYPFRSRHNPTNGQYESIPRET